MISNIETDQVLEHARKIVGQDLLLVTENKRGSRSLVLTVNNSRHDFVIKAGPDTETDYFVLNLLHDLRFPSPTLIAYSDIHNDYGLVIMSKLSGIQARNLPLTERFHVVSALMDEMGKLKICKSDSGAGEIKKVCRGRGSTWTGYLNQVLDRAEEDLRANNLINKDLVDWKSIQTATELIRIGIENLPTDLDLCLLHNDLNLANCIVTPVESNLLGVVDWSDAIYGEQLYDFSRLKMNLEQSNDEESLRIYKSKLAINGEESGREQLYYLCRLVEYLGIYGKYGSEHWFNRNQQLLSQTISNW
jgi:aminoglycoside phosphotransferase